MRDAALPGDGARSCLRDGLCDAAVTLALSPMGEVTAGCGNGTRLRTAKAERRQRAMSYA